MNEIFWIEDEQQALDHIPLALRRRGRAVRGFRTASEFLNSIVEVKAGKGSVLVDLDLPTEVIAGEKVKHQHVGLKVIRVLIDEEISPDRIIVLSGNLSLEELELLYPQLPKDNLFDKPINQNLERLLDALVR